MESDKAPRGAALTALGSFAFSSALVLALSFAVAWPLWSLATREKSAFTMAVAAGIVLWLFFFVLRAVGRRLTRPGRRRAP
jgi:hypothetical protein